MSVLAAAECGGDWSTVVAFAIFAFIVCFIFWTMGRTM